MRGGLIAAGVVLLGGAVLSQLLARRISDATWIAVAGYSTFIINYFGVNIFASGLHSYSGM